MLYYATENIHMHLMQPQVSISSNSSKQSLIAMADQILAQGGYRVDGRPKEEKGTSIRAIPVPIGGKTSRR